MSAIDTALAVIEALNRLNADYLMVGSMASNYYSIARSTRDVDFVVEMRKTPLDRLLAELRPRFKLEPQATFETVTGATRFILYDSQSPILIDLFELGDDEHNRHRFERKQNIMLEGTPVWIPSVEDVLVTKLRWASHALRRKDQDDIRDVLAVQGGSLDWDYLHSWCDRHGTRKLLDDIRKSIPPI